MRIELELSMTDDRVHGAIKARTEVGGKEVKMAQLLKVGGPELDIRAVDPLGNLTIRVCEIIRATLRHAHSALGIEVRDFFLNDEEREETYGGEYSSKRRCHVEGDETDSA